MPQSLISSILRFAYDHYLTIELVLLVLFLISLALKFRWKSAYNKLLSEREEDRLKARDEISRANRFIDHKKAEAKRELAQLQAQIEAKSKEQAALIVQIGERSKLSLQIKEDIEKTEKDLLSLNKKYEKSKYLLDSFAEVLAQYASGTLPSSKDYLAKYHQLKKDLNISPALEVQAMSIKQLRKQFTDIKKQIKDLYAAYDTSYSNELDIIIYKLLVCAVEEGVKNILSSMRYGKLDSAIDKFRMLTGKCFEIAIEGSKSIVAPLSRFIGQLEYLYILAIKTEYEYYIKQEQAKEEQRAIKERIRQEAMENRILNQQRKQVENEEKKYLNEIERLNNQLASAFQTDEMLILKQRIKEVEALLAKVGSKKEEIVTLQHGKAGTVYVISNLGSFGEDVFKIGMTRRLEPMERIYELSSASVPFPFDVHSMIFSEDAVSLETDLHKRLYDKRINKINPRKEFFKVSIDEIEQIVNDIDPSAPFHKTILAEQFYQSESITD